MNPAPKNKPNKNRSFLDWIARQPCSTCGSRGEYHEKIGEWLVTPSHLTSRGAGGGDEGNVIPQCLQCHVELGKWGIELFNKVNNVDLRQIAMDMLKKWNEPNRTKS